MPSGDRISVRIPEGMLAEVDHHAKRRGWTRNFWIAKAVRRCLDGEEIQAPSGLPRADLKTPGRPAPSTTPKEKKP